MNRRVRERIRWPALLVELDTTGVGREDVVIHVAGVLVDLDADGRPEMVAQYVGLQEPPWPSKPDALAYHGLRAELLQGKSIDIAKLAELVGQASTVISRHPKITARKLHALVPGCLEKTWYEYPDRIQGYPGEIFPALRRMQVLIGEVESFGYGRLHTLGNLLSIDAEQYTLVFDEDGPPQVTVKFGRRKVLEGFPEAMLKCQEGTRFRLHGAEGYDFITGYCNDGPAFRERAFRLATTPSNLELVDRHHLHVYLEKIEGLTYHLALAPPRAPRARR